MFEQLLVVFILVLLTVLLYGAALIVGDRQREYLERRKLREQIKKKDCQIFPINLDNKAV